MVVVEARVLDSTHLELSKPILVPLGGKLVVSLAEPGDADADRSMWLAASRSSLAAAYGESEPEYTLNLVKEPNPEFKR